jgi:uncharacterized protein (DUF433 family)
MSVFYPRARGGRIKRLRIRSPRGVVMKAEVAIVDLGRGPQLVGTRVTVPDLLPYFQAGYTHAEIAEVMPLTLDEIGAVRQYIEEHREAVLEEDRVIRERNAARRNSPEVEETLRQARAERLNGPLQLPRDFR